MVCLVVHEELALDVLLQPEYTSKAGFSLQILLIYFLSIYTLITIKIDVERKWVSEWVS